MKISSVVNNVELNCLGTFIFHFVMSQKETYVYGFLITKFFLMCKKRQFNAIFKKKSVSLIISLQKQTKSIVRQ